jgi:hypothetical protein
MGTLGVRLASDDSHRSVCSCTATYLQLTYYPIRLDIRLLRREIHWNFNIVKTSDLPDAFMLPKSEMLVYLYLRMRQR